MQRGITAKTDLYAIIGRPVKHSLSPVMHNAAFTHLGIDAVYLAFETPDAEGALKAMTALGIRGYSVTIPHKQAVIDFLDEMDDSVRAIGACNTIKNHAGRLLGTNTDWLGAVKALEGQMELRDKHAVVLGAGGSARAIVYGLLKRGARVSICNRTKEKAFELAEIFSCSGYGLDEVGRLKGDILINTTSVGMAPDSDRSPVSDEVVDRFKLVMDIVYSPLETKLLQVAKKLNKIVINGLQMLLYQAVAQFEFWTGQSAPVEKMKEALEENVRSN